MEPFDQQRDRIQDDLRGLIAGDVRFDDVFRELYASDGSIHEITPLGVIRPRSVADVVACVRYAAEKGIPIHARGAGTGVAGESLGPGLVLDFSKYMRRVVRAGRLPFAKRVDLTAATVVEVTLRPDVAAFGFAKMLRGR